MKQLNRYLTAFLAVLIAVVLCAPTMAQTATGIIDGTVKDSSGAVIPGVEVTVTHTGTGSSRTSVTNDEGRFRITNVPFGPYQAEAKLTGFETALTSFDLDVAERQTLNFTLNVGEITTVTEVTDVAQTVNTEEGTLSTVVEERYVADMPLNGRNVFSLALAMPNVTQGINDGIAGESGINASGARVRGNNFSLDGVSNNDPIGGGEVALTPNLDTVAEFRIQNNNFSAEYGRNNGSVINVVTKSGSNTVHGSVYWYHRNDAMDAGEIFDAWNQELGEKEQAPLRQHQAGFTIGGPIIPNKTFWFFGYEAFHTTTGESSLARYETAAFRDSVHRNNPGSLADTLLQTFPGPTPTQDFTDPGSYSGIYQSPGAPDGIDDTGRVSFFSPETTKNYQYNIRIDHELTDNNKLFGRYIWEDQETPGNNIRSAVLASDFDGMDAQGVLSDTHIFSPTVVNELRFGYSRDTTNWNSEPGIADFNIFNWFGGDGISGFGAYGGLPQFFTGEEYHLVDVVSLSKGDHGLKVGFEYRWNQDDSDFQYLAQGYFGYGGMWDFAAALPYSAGYRIDPGQVGGVPSLVGTPHNFRQGEFGFFIQDDWKVSDRLTLNLGVRYDNYGELRDARDPRRLANIILGSGNDVFERVMNSTVGQVDSSGVFASDNNNWAPRLGFAYDLMGDGKTSIRGGFGVAYDRLFLNVSGNIRFNPPSNAAFWLGDWMASDLGLSGEQLAGVLATGATYPVSFPEGFVSNGYNPGGGPLLGYDDGVNSGQTGGRISLRSPDPSMRSSYSMNWFLGIQRELPWDMLGEVNYVGNGGRKLGFIEQYNRFEGDRFGLPNPYTGEHAGNTSINYLSPWFSSENLRTNSINSSYHGGSVAITKRFSDGIAFSSAFTFGKVLDYGSDNFSSNAGSIFTVSPGNTNLERGNSSFDVPQRWVNSLIWEIPFMRSQQGVLGQILGGWQTQFILSMQKGTPFTVQTTSGSSRDYNGDGRNNDRPDAPANGYSAYNNVSKQTYIDGIFGDDPQSVFNPNGIPCDRGGTATSATSCTTPGIGTMGRSMFRQQGYNNVDFSLFKNFRVPWVGQEDARIQFRAEFFNFFNRVNLGATQRSFSSSSLGRVSSALDAREIQLALKFIF